VEISIPGTTVDATFLQIETLSPSIMQMIDDIFSTFYKYHMSIEQ